MDDLFDELDGKITAPYDLAIDHWKGMPEHNPRDITDCYHEITVNFETDEDFESFKQKTGMSLLTSKTKSTYFPPKPRVDYSVVKVIGKKPELNQPRYPIYIVSKSRWEKRLTSDSLVEMRVPHYMVVEESQYDAYRNVCDPDFVTVIILDQKYLDEYDTFDDLGTSKSKGPGAARNFAWDHSISLGAKRHWVMDDNARGFYRMVGNQRIPVADGTILRAMEDHSDRYENLYISGPCYRFFVPPAERLPALFHNTRIYSCLLIKNDIPYRWRGRYNEDTDLSLRVLKDGHCTFQYTQFLYDKIATQTMGGGNSEAFYFEEGTVAKSQMLVDMHPDVARMSDRFGRAHHYVDYSGYRMNRLKYVDGFDLSTLPEIDNYGMVIDNA